MGPFWMAGVQQVQHWREHSLALRLPQSAVAAFFPGRGWRFCRTRAIKTSAASGWKGYERMLAQLSAEQEGVLRPLTSDSSGGDSLLLSSRATPWAGLPLDVHRLRNADELAAHGPPAGEYGVVAFLDGNLELGFDLGGREIRQVARRGAVAFVSGSERYTVTYAAGSADAAVVRLPHSWFERALLD